METPTPRRAKRLGALAIAIVMGAGLIGVLAPAAVAQESNGDENPATEHHVLTDEQRACLEEHGVTKPEDGTRPTDEQRQAFHTAAEACGIDLPLRHHRRLTDEQRACLQEHGVTKPERGTRPTDEQRQAFRAAAEACDIQLRRPRLTDEQRACLQEHGVTKPERGTRPTDEQRQAFRAAAEACGINLPDRPQSDNGDASSGDNA